MDFSNVDAEDLLARLDISNARLTSSGTEVNFSCYGPEHSHGDESPSAYINTTSLMYFCHGCKRRGTAVTLVMDVHDVSRATAERQLRDWYGIEFNEPQGGSMTAETEARFREVPEKQEHTRPPDHWVRSTIMDWEQDLEAYQAYMLDRGFTPETLDSWMIGYDFMSNRITIPIYDIDGNVLGIKGRDYTGERDPKYLILGDRSQQRYGFQPYEASEVVFGLHRAREQRVGVLVEGELNAVALNQMGVDRPFATGMSYLTDRHLQLIIRECDEIVVWYDYGEAGWHGMWGMRNSAGKWKPGAVQMLEQYMPVRIVQAIPSDPADLLKAGCQEVAIELLDGSISSLVMRAELV